MGETAEKDPVANERIIESLQKILADAQFALVNADNKKTLKAVKKIVKSDIKAIKKSQFALPSAGGEEVVAAWERLDGCVCAFVGAEGQAYRHAKSDLEQFASEIKDKIKALTIENKVEKVQKTVAETAATGFAKLKNIVSAGVEKIKGQVCNNGEQENSEE